MVKVGGEKVSGIRTMVKWLFLNHLLIIFFLRNAQKDKGDEKEAKSDEQINKTLANKLMNQSPNVRKMRV